MTTANAATYENKPGCSDYAECSEHRICTDEAGGSAQGAGSGALTPASSGTGTLVAA